MESHRTLPMHRHSTPINNSPHVTCNITAEVDGYEKHTEEIEIDDR